MKNRGIAAAVICAGLAASSAGPLRAQWAMTFGRAANDQPGSILIAPDGGTIVSGYSQYTAGLAQASEAWLWVLKLDREGLIAWQHIWDCSSLSDVFNRSSAVVAAPDGGCLLAATYKPRNHSDSYALLVRLSPDGIVLWQKAYGFGGGSFVG